MREHRLLAPARVGVTMITSEGQAAVFVVVYHCSAECVGIHADARATRFEALEPIRQGLREHFGGFGSRGLAVRHDHGLQYLSDAFQNEPRLSRNRKLTRLRARPGGQWLRRTFHPHLEGEPLMGAYFRNHREIALGAARIPRHLQHHLAH
jgi:putative transposase